METATALHTQRINAVIQVLQESAAQSVLDLGCGPGYLLARLARMARFTRIAGVDICPAALAQARNRLEGEHETNPDHVSFFTGSFTEADARFTGFHAAIMLETIEHIDPDKLSLVENAVFGSLRPPMVIMTTPNRDYNHILGVPPHRMRHPDHRFEWPRDKFESWCRGVAARNGYEATFEGIGGCHPYCGAPTQMAVLVFNNKESMQ